jgi:hypothetical protein
MVGQAEPGFWTEVWNFAGVAGDRGLRASVDLDDMPGGRFFRTPRSTSRKICCGAGATARDLQQHRVGP